MSQVKAGLSKRFIHTINGLLVLITTVDVTLQLQKSVFVDMPKKEENIINV